MIAQSFQFALAFALAMQGVMLMHRALPRVIDARGHWQGYCHLLLAFVLLLGFQPWFERGLAGDPLNGWHFARDLILLTYAWCRYRRAMRMSDTTWACDGEGR